MATSSKLRSEPDSQREEPEEAMDLLRIFTAGAVDDGKSTLIGRLLYDTQSVYDDHVRAIAGKGTTPAGVLDLALLTDGLRAEREQGITIDVAYRYFSTPQRRFILADTPGHVQYTRNMVTGASTADAAILLLDARKGLQVQARRHAAIVVLLRVQHVVVAINKMDAVAYDEVLFQNLRHDFSAFLATLKYSAEQSTQPNFLPISAINGDNVVNRSSNMPWYTGPPLLALLEALPHENADAAPFRFPVQRVVRAQDGFRGYAGRIASGSVRPGDSVALPFSNRTSRVQRIVTYSGDLQEAAAPLSVTLTLADEIDVSRGDIFTAATTPTLPSNFDADVVWMDAAPLKLGSRYLLKHTTRTVVAEITRVHATLHLDDAPSPPTPSVLSQLDDGAARLTFNGIGRLSVRTLRPLALESYAENSKTGCFILIDPVTNGTVAAGMALSINPPDEKSTKPNLFWQPVTPQERALRFHHTAAHLILCELIAIALERVLFESGCLVVRIGTAESLTVGAQAELLRAGAIVLDASTKPPHMHFQIAGQPAQTLASGPAEALEQILTALRMAGVLLPLMQAADGKDSA